jgi:hypothetical protein
VIKRTTLAVCSLVLSLLPIACAPEVEGDDGAAGVGNVAGSGGASGSGGNGGTGGASTGGTGGSVAGTGGATGGTGGATGGTGGTLAGSSGAGGSVVGGAGAGASAGSAGLGGAGSGGAAGGGAGAGNGGAGGDAAGSANGGAGGAAAGNSGQGGVAGASGKGGAGGAGNGGSGGTSGFAPCPATGACKILPLGDSITDGIGFSGGYRVHLFELAVMNDKEITFVGGSMNGPQTVSGQMFPRAHEGHSGWTIAQIDGIVPDPALNVAPHIVLLHIGTNDMYQGPSGAADRLGTLIDQILTDLPNALLVVSNIIPFPGQAGQVTTFNQAVPGVVMTRANQGKHILFVDQFTGFPTSELGDGVHPNQAGYNRMADKWYAAISSYLP